MRLRLGTLAALAFALLEACADSHDPAPTPPPILDTPPEARFACTETRALEDQTPLTWTGHALSASSDHLIFARIELEAPRPPNYEPGDGHLVVSSISPDGDTDRRELASAPPYSRFTLAGFQSTPAGWVLAYSKSSELHFAAFDANTNTVTDQTLAPEDQDAYGYRLAPRLNGGWLLAWRTLPSHPNPIELRTLAIDDSGRALGAPHTLLTTNRNTLTFELTTGAIIWTDRPDRSATLTLAKLDDTGTTATPFFTRTFDSWGLTFAGEQPALHAAPDGFTAAWPETTSDGEHGRTTLWLARFDREGAVLMDPRPLTTPQDDVEHVDAELFDLHGELGLIWSQGQVIYECGGCVPDHDLRLVALDHQTLKPLSEVLALDWPQAGGLLGHSTAIAGESIAVATRIQFHTSSAAALAFARCAAR